MSNDIVILAKATGAGNSDDVDVYPGAPATLSIFPEANFGSDVGALMKKNPDGTYDQVYDDALAAIELKATKPHIIVDASGTFRIEFSARTAAIGVTKLQYQRF